MIISFELTMPNAGSWNGKWTGADKKYYIIKKISKRFFDKQDYFNELKSKGKDYWHYSFGDGWGANVTAQIIDGAEASKRRKLSKGFAGYNWMIDSIIYHGIIETESQRKTQLILQK